MGKARSKPRSAHHHRWNWQCWNGSPIVRVENGIVEFVEELCRRFGLFDDLASGFTISSNMGNECIGDAT